MSLRKVLAAVAGMILVCVISAVGALGQETPPQSQTAPAQDESVRRDRIERMQKRRERSERREGIAGHRGHSGIGRHGEIGRLMGELNLTDEQRQQRGAIMERQLESTKVQREELFRLGEKRRAGTFTTDDEARARALHQELRNSMENVRSEMDGILTAEQKAKLEELKSERKQKREQRKEQRMKERQERLNKKPLSL
ncbi:MAG TPA: Spy/CpxP family protein refolding chaperone [Pyrinomonadaceae bacterium]|nr:Spy/CpxP family protein refolding chaperone [Pyrinomonadaceae bacterium]